MRWTGHPGEPGGDDVPFAPTAPRPAAAAPIAHRAFEWSQRFRFPVGVAFNLLIVAAAFFAYSASRSTDPGTDQADPVAPAAPSSEESLTSFRTPSAADAPSTTDTLDETEARDDALGFRGGALANERWSPTSSAPGAPGPGAASSDPPGVPGDDRRVTPRSTTQGAPPEEPERPTGDAAGAPTTSTSPPPSSTSAAPTTPTTAAQPEPAFIGDRVRAVDGDGFGGVEVSLRRDDDPDDRDPFVGTDTTDSDGYYGFTVEPGCYVVDFTVPSDTTVTAGNRQQRICVTSGERFVGADLTLRVVPPVAPPPACDVQTGDNAYAGVEIRDTNRAWAPGYVFYGSSGNVIVRTVNLGPPDDTTNPDGNQIEWTSARYGYEESDVYSVAAEDAAGNVSAPTTCSRRSV